MNIPNLLTMLRITLIPIYLLIFFSNIKNRIIIAGILFILAGFTDVLDGFIARKYKIITKLGTVLDPFADKMMTFAVLISFTWSKLIPPWILIAIGIKETIMILGGIILYFFRDNQVLPSNQYGKVATLFFYAATLSVIFHLPHLMVKALFIITVILNLVAFVNYLTIYLSMRKDNLV